MTEYEKLSLQFQAAIAQGIGMLLTRDDMTSPAANEEFRENVLRWHATLLRLTLVVNPQE